MSGLNDSLKRLHQLSQPFGHLHASDMINYGFETFEMAPGK